MLRWLDLVWMSDEQLARFDIAEVNLACAVDLPGTDKIDHRACIEKLDTIAGWVRKFTEECRAGGEAEKHGDTEAQLRMRCLPQVVWHAANIVYNPARIPEDSPWGMEDSFIHGALFGPGGTCATLPVIYTAIGRRLGYPLKLVSARGVKSDHLFCRWDDPTGERFNVEVNDTGVSFPPDDHYRKAGLSPELERHGHFLQSKTPRQELSGFLATRAMHWRQAGDLEKSVDSFIWALGLSPTNIFLANTLNASYNAWYREVTRIKPPGFPEMYLSIRQRRYLETVPIRIEKDHICLELMSRLLKDPYTERTYWSHLRSGNRSARLPKAIEAIWTPAGTESRFTF